MCGRTPTHRAHHTIRRNARRVSLARAGAGGVHSRPGQRRVAAPLEGEREREKHAARPPLRAPANTPGTMTSKDGLGTRRENARPGLWGRALGSGTRALGRGDQTLFRGSRVELRPAGTYRPQTPA